MLLVEDFYQRFQDVLKIEIIGGEKGLSRSIQTAGIQRAGLFLTGYTKHYDDRRILVFGKQEVHYLCELKPNVALERLDQILTDNTPFVIVSRNFFDAQLLLEICQKKSIVLFKIDCSTSQIQHKLSVVLNDEFSPLQTRHGTFIEVFDVGVLLEGDSSIGKSEAALSLIERGHRLIADDVVCLKLKKGTHLEGQGVELTRHLMEIRGIGIINVAMLYGAYSVRDRKEVHMIIKLTEWNDNQFYDRMGLEETTSEILGLEVPLSLLPVKPGRDVTLLIETIALNYRLKQMGYHAAQDFKVRQNRKIAERLNSKR